MNEAHTTNPQDAIDQTVLIASSAVWLPHALTLLYATLMSSNSAVLLVLLVTIAVIAVTVFCAKRLNGDWLMLVAFATGFTAEVAGFEQASGATVTLPRFTWVIVSALHGVIAAILCKAKDKAEGHYYIMHTIAERLYFVVPFVIGQWWGVILTQGWDGLVAAFCSIFLCLATVGYAVVGYRFLDDFHFFDTDLLTMVARLFTTSFGVVFGTFITSVLFVIYLAIPFASSLFSLNALVNSAGMITEVLIYEMA